MNPRLKKNIIRISLLALWMVLGSSVLVLLVAAINIKNHKLSKGIDIKIVGVKEIYFLDKADIMKIVSDQGITKPAGTPITSFNLQRLEAVLENNVWVKDAELFFDNNLLLHINILEKEPIARIFTNNGNSFYIDSSAGIMPLNNKMNVKLPVFTGFPDNVTGLKKEDSILMSQIKNVTMYVLKDKFWLAQIAQVDINADKNFELVPTVGNHIIEFGNGYNFESKFKRLLIFYKQVLSHTGLDTYKKISVQYDSQVIGTKKGMVTKIDSVQALKNIQKMIEDAKKFSEDSADAPPDKLIAPALTPDSMIMDSKIDSENAVPEKVIGNSNIILKPVVIKNKPATEITTVKKAAVKAGIESSSGKPAGKPVDIKQKPKAENTSLNKPVSKPLESKHKPKALMGKLNK